MNQSLPIRLERTGHLPRLARLLTHGGRRSARLAQLLLLFFLSLPLALVLQVALRQGHTGFRWAAPVMRAWCRWALRILRIELRVSGQPLRLPHLTVANHISYLDILCIAALRPYRFLAKSELGDWPLFGWFARLTHTLFIERGRSPASHAAMLAVAEALRAGDPIALFPEGTSTRGGAPGPFYPALFEAALRAGCPIQPIALHYASRHAPAKPHPRAAFIGDDDLLPHLWRLLAEPGIVAHLHYCEPLAPLGTRRDLAHQARNTIAEQLRAMRPDLLATH